MRPNAATKASECLKSEHLFSEWTSACDALEADGNWPELLAKIEVFLREPQGWRGLIPRWQAALARMWIFQGRLPEAREILDHLESGQAISEPDTQMLIHLCRSTLSRRDSRWAEAHYFAEAATRFAEKSSASHLLADATFNSALCFAEEGRIFFALDLFQQIRSGKIPSSPFRQGMAALSEAWMLWDIGQAEGVRRVLPSIPEAFAERIEVCLALLEGDLKKIENWARTGPSRSATTDHERRQIALLLTEGLVIFGSVSNFRGRESWLRGFLESQSGKAFDLVAHEKNRACLALLDGKTYEAPKNTKLGWRFFLELSFLEALSKKSKEIYLGVIDPLLQEHRLSTPLIPAISDIGRARWSWTRHVAQWIGIQPQSESGPVFRSPKAASDGSRANK